MDPICAEDRRIKMIMDKIRKAVRSFLRIEPSQRQYLSIQEQLDFYGEAYVNKLWYRGSAAELNQLYRQLDNATRPFWGSVPTYGLEVRKIHTGIARNNGFYQSSTLPVHLMSKHIFAHRIIPC